MKSDVEERCGRGGVLLRPRADRESRIDLPHSYDVMADPLSRRHPRTPARSNRPPPQSRSSAAPQLQRPSHPTFPFRLSLFPSPCPSTRAAGPPTLELLTCTPISSAPASLISAGKRRLDFILNAFFSRGREKRSGRVAENPVSETDDTLIGGRRGFLVSIWRRGIGAVTFCRVTVTGR